MAEPELTKPEVTTPEVTVLLPVRNGAAHLREALESISAQTFQGMEILVIDDGSDDGTAEILRSHAARDGRVRVLEQPPTGLIRTLNRGLAEARAPLIARHDADDLSDPTRIAKQVARMTAQPDIALLGTATAIFEAGATETLVVFPESHEQICDGFLLGNMFAHGSVMFRKELVVRAGGYRDLPETHYVEDLDLWMRLARAHRVENLGECLYRYRNNPAGISVMKAAEQERHAQALLARLRAERGYRDFWTVPRYSLVRWARGMDREAVARGLRVIRILWRLGERSAAAWRFIAMITFHPLGSLRALATSAGRRARAEAAA